MVAGGAARGRRSARLAAPARVVHARADVAGRGGAELSRADGSRSLAGSDRTAAHYAVTYAVSSILTSAAIELHTISKTATTFTPLPPPRPPLLQRWGGGRGHWHHRPPGRAVGLAGRHGAVCGAATASWGGITRSMSALLSHGAHRAIFSGRYRPTCALLCRQVTVHVRRAWSSSAASHDQSSVIC